MTTYKVYEALNGSRVLRMATKDREKAIQYWEYTKFQYRKTWIEEVEE